jgi:hypothetical protein
MKEKLFSLHSLLLLLLLLLCVKKGKGEKIELRSSEMSSGKRASDESESTKKCRPFNATQNGIFNQFRDEMERFTPAQ